FLGVVLAKLVGLIEIAVLEILGDRLAVIVEGMAFRLLIDARPMASVALMLHVEPLVHLGVLRVLRMSVVVLLDVLWQRRKRAGRDYAGDGQGQGKQHQKEAHANERLHGSSSK